MIPKSTFKHAVKNILKEVGLIGNTDQIYPKMFIGSVVSKVDVMKSGAIQVNHPILGKPVSVAYSTPHFSKGCGFFAVPEKNSVVLVAEVPFGKALFNRKVKRIYIATIPFPDVDLVKPGTVFTDEEALPDKDIYKFRGRPMKYIWKSLGGHAFIMSDLYEANEFNQKIEMKSALGKQISLDDTKDCIIAQNEHGDHIKLTTGNGGAPQQASRSLYLKSKGDHFYESTNGTMEIEVVDGGNLNIVNGSKGKMAAPESSDWGKVNIMAQNNDVTITANKGMGTSMADIPSVFISTIGNNSVIQINSRGKMDIQINKGINIISEAEDINIVSQQGDINLTAEQGDINLSTPQGKIYLN